MSLAWWWYPPRRFTIDGLNFEVRMTARTDGLRSVLTMLGVEQARDATPMMGPEATRNHTLIADLPDGRRLAVEAGYHGAWTTGIVARLDGRVVHESHPGQPPRFPEKYRAQTETTTHGAFAPRNLIPLTVDIATGLLFFVVAKLTDLQTAAFVGVAVGIALIVFQRVTKIDVTGGLALFGIAMLCISAGLAWWFADEEWIKQRSTIVGLLASSLFLLDGLLGGKRLASALTRYMPYPDIVPARLGIGMGVAGIVLAGANFLVARFTSTDVWLFYSTFLDIFVFMALFLGVLRYARPPQQRA
jgi:intracellular septation protein A